MMTIIKAVEHFEFKLNPKNNIWKATKNDIEAYNTICDFVDNKNKKQLNDYHLFAKLYVMVYAQYLERYKGTIFDDIPKRELHQLIDKPISFFIKRFTKRLNESELYSLFNELNIKLEHPAVKTAKDKQKDLNALKTSLSQQNNKNRLFGDVWDYETVKENLELQINNVINKYK